MSRDELSIIQEIIAEEMDLNPQDITEEMTLDEDLDMDQNSILQVLMACEVEFNVEYEQEDTLVSRYRILTRCVLCAAANSNASLTVGRFESSILNWLTNAGIRLSMAELVYLHERQIKPTKDILYTDNRQKLVETIYTQENIFDNILECQMEHATCRDKVTAATMVLLKNKKIVIL